MGDDTFENHLSLESEDSTPNLPIPLPAVEPMSEEMLSNLVQKAQQDEREKQLIEGARLKNEEAWDLIHEHYSPGIRSFIRRDFIRKRLSEYVSNQVELKLLVNDAVNDTIALAFRLINNYEARPGKPFMAWLIGLAKNVCHEKCRQIIKHRWQADILSSDIEECQNAEAPDEYDRVGDREIIAQVFKEESSKNKLIIYLARIKGLPYQEVSQKTGTTESTVKMIVKRFRDRVNFMRMDKLPDKKTRNQEKKQKPHKSDYPSIE